MPVVGRCDDDGVHVRALQHPARIKVRKRRESRLFRDCDLGRKSLRIHIAEGNQPDPRLTQQVTNVASPFVPETDDGKPDVIVCTTGSAKTVADDGINEAAGDSRLTKEATAGKRGGGRRDRGFHEGEGPRVGESGVYWPAA